MDLGRGAWQASVNGGHVAGSGWYPDPGGTPQWRYFDGDTWSEQVRSFSAPAATPPDGVAAPGATSLSATKPTNRWGRTLIAVGVVTVVVAGAATALTFMDRNGSEGVVAAPEPTDAATTEALERDESVQDPQEAAIATEAPAGSELRDLREVSWSRQPWPTTCSALYEELDATLSRPAVFEVPGTLEFASSAGQTPVVFTVWVDEVVHGDITGDGHVEAIFRTQCFHGNDSVQMLEVWSTDKDGQPTLLPTVTSWSKFDGQLESFEVADGAIRAITAEGLPEDDHPHLNGYPIDVVTDWRFRDGGWSETEISRSEAAMLPACAAPNSSPENAVNCLVTAVAAGDHGAALLAADVSVVEQFIEAQNEGWLEHWEFSDCSESMMLASESGLSCYFYDPPSDDSEFHGTSIEIAVESGITGWFLTELDYIG